MRTRTDTRRTARLWPNRPTLVGQSFARPLVHAISQSLSSGSGSAAAEIIARSLADATCRGSSPNYDSTRRRRALRLGWPMKARHGPPCGELIEPDARGAAPARGARRSEAQRRGRARYPARCEPPRSTQGPPRIMCRMFDPLPHPERGRRASSRIMSARSSSPGAQGRAL
jgi:hypothetical protein